MEMASKVARFKELSYLDLSSRLDISLSKEDSPYEQSEKIYAAVQSDIVASNLLNLAWEEFVLHRRYQTFNLLNVAHLGNLRMCFVVAAMCTIFKHFVIYQLEGS